jgi:hypothetical protein
MKPLIGAERFLISCMLSNTHAVYPITTRPRRQTNPKSTRAFPLYSYLLLLMLSPASQSVVSLNTQTFFAVALTDPCFSPETFIWAPDAAHIGGVAAGTVVGAYTTGPNAGKVGAYDNAATDGRETAIGIITNSIPEEIAQTNDASVTVYTAGKFKTNGLTGLDPNATTDLGGRVNGDVLTF